MSATPFDDLAAQFKQQRSGRLSNRVIMKTPTTSDGAVFAYVTLEHPDGITPDQLKAAPYEIQRSTVLSWFLANYSPDWSAQTSDYPRNNETSDQTNIRDRLGEFTFLDDIFGYLGMEVEDTVRKISTRWVSNDFSPALSRSIDSTIKSLHESSSVLKNSIHRWGHNGGPPLEDDPHIEIADIEETAGELEEVTSRPNPDPGILQKAVAVLSRAKTEILDWSYKRTMAACSTATMFTIGMLSTDWSKFLENLETVRILAVHLLQLLGIR